MSPQSSGEKTEKATPKKRRDAREKGQVVKSMDAVTALSMAVVLAGISLFGGGMVNDIKAMMISAFTMDMAAEFNTADLLATTGDTILRFLTAVLPILLVALAAGMAFNILQVGFMFNPKLLKPKFSRINPLEGFKRMFSKRTFIELIKSVVKIAVLGMVAYSEYQVQVKKTENMMAESLTTAINTMLDMLSTIGFKLVIALVIMAPFDFFFQWRKHEKDLMMTKQEIKDEYKLSEGDPQIKSRIRQKQRQMSAMRMMQAVGAADVVITNPTHYAIALQYDESTNKAPLIVAKGKDFLAQKIKEEAAKHHVAMVENRQLAQYLYFFCEIGDEVPEEMYQAVAEILAYIYKMKQTGRGVRG